MQKSDLETLTAVAKELDIKSWQYPLILLASIKVGTSKERLRDFTKIDAETIAAAVDRLISNGVFIGDEINVSWLDSGDGLALSLDSMVAEGTLRRVYNDSQGISYTLTREGVLQAESLLTNNADAREFAATLGLIKSFEKIEK